MVLETDNKTYESEKERVHRRSSFPMRSVNSLHYSTSLSLQILERVNRVCEELQPKSREELIPGKESPISHSPTKSDDSNNESGYSEYSPPSRIINSTTFTVQAMDTANSVPSPKSPELQTDSKESEDGNRSTKRPLGKQRKNKFGNITTKTSPRISGTIDEAAKDETAETNDADVDLCDSGAESASPEKDLNNPQPSTEMVTLTTPVKNGKSKFGGLRKRKSLDKSSRKSSLRNETPGDESPSPSLLSSSSSTAKSTPSHNGRRDSPSPSPSLPLSLPLQDGSSSIYSIVEYEGAKKMPKKADVETMRAMGLTEERKPKLSHRASFKMWKRSALQYIKSHATNVSKGKMYRMNTDVQAKDDDEQNCENETPEEQQQTPTNDDNHLAVTAYNPAVNTDLSPMEECKPNCSPMYKCYPVRTSPYTDEKTRKWRRVRRAFSELYPTRCIDTRIADDEHHMNRKSEQKGGNRKNLLSISKTNSQFDLRSIGSIEIDAAPFVSDSFNSEVSSLRDRQIKDAQMSSDDRSKSDKNSLCVPVSYTEKSELPVLPPKSNGLYQTAPHRIDLQKYVINPNRDNCRRSSAADIPTAKSADQNTYETQREQHSKSLESSRIESELKEETISPRKEGSAFEKVPNEGFPLLSSSGSSSSTFQLINISPDSNSTSSTQTTNTSASRDVSSIPTSQISSCTTSNNLTTSTSSSATTSSDDATVSPTFEEYARAHGGMNFSLGLGIHSEMPARDPKITSRGVTANLTPIHGRDRRSSTTVNRATSPMNCEIEKDNTPLKTEVSFNKKSQTTTTEESQNITRSSCPQGFRRTQEISCRLISPDQVTTTRNTYLIPSKSVSPGLVTTRYPRNTKDTDMAYGNNLNVYPLRKSQSNESIDKKEIENERNIQEYISKAKETSISDSKTVADDEEPPPLPPPRRRPKEIYERIPSPSILKKNTSVSTTSQGLIIQEGKGKDKRETDSPSLTKIPTSRRNTNNQGSPVRSVEKSSSPIAMRKVSKPASPLPKREFSSRPTRVSKSMPSSPDLKASRGLRIAGGLPSTPDISPKRTNRATTHVPPSGPEISSKMTRAFATRQPSPEPAISKRSRITREKSLDSDGETVSKDPDADGTSVGVKANSNKIPFPEAAPLKNSRMSMTGKQANPDAGVPKNNRVMTPKRVNVTTGLQLATRPVPVKTVSTEASKNSRIPVSKSTRPDVIPKKSGRLAMNRLVNPNANVEKCLKSVNYKSARPVSAHSKYSQPRSEETFAEPNEMARAVSCEVGVGSATHHEMNRHMLSNSARSVCIDPENDLTPHEMKSSPSDDSFLKSESYEMQVENEAEILGISLDQINRTRRNRFILEKTLSCQAESGSPPQSPTTLLTNSQHPVGTMGKAEESPFSAGELMRQDAAAQTTDEELSSGDNEVGTTNLSLLKQDMGVQIQENELQTGLLAGVCGIVPVVTRQTPHQIKMGGAALRARVNTDLVDVNGTKHTSKTLDNKWELTNYNEHVQQIMVVEEGQARLYDLKPASCQSIQLISPSEYSLGSAISTDNSCSTDPYLTESASVDRCMGSLANSRYRYNLSNSMAGGLDAIAQNSADQNMFESSGSLKDNTNGENVPRRRRAASLSNIEYPRKTIDKKNRKRSRLSTFLDKFQRKKKTTIVSEDVDLPTHFRTIGRILEMCLDGTRIIELTQPPHGLCGIYMARIEHNFGSGIYVSRFCDGYPEKMFSGLLAIGDQILEINGIPTDKITVEECHDMVASGTTLILRVMPDPTNYRVSTLPR